MQREEIMQQLDIGLRGYNSLRSIYFGKKRIKKGEEFTSEIVHNELKKIVEFQKKHPRYSYLNCYEHVISENAKQALLDMITPNDDPVGMALSNVFLEITGDEADQFFESFNKLSDFCRRFHDESSQQVLIQLQETIMASIIAKNLINEQNKVK